MSYGEIFQTHLLGMRMYVVSGDHIAKMVWKVRRGSGCGLHRAAGGSGAGRGCRRVRARVGPKP